MCAMLLVLHLQKMLQKALKREGSGLGGIVKHTCGEKGTESKGRINFYQSNMDTVHVVV